MDPLSTIGGGLGILQALFGGGPKPAPQVIQPQGQVPQIPMSQGFANIDSLINGPNSTPVSEPTGDRTRRSKYDSVQAAQPANEPAGDAKGVLGLARELAAATRKAPASEGTAMQQAAAKGQPMTDTMPPAPPAAGAAAAGAGKAGTKAAKTGAAPAGQQGGSTFLGLKGDQWAAIGTATGILANLFQRNQQAAQVLNPSIPMNSSLPLTSLGGDMGSPGMQRVSGLSQFAINQPSISSPSFGSQADILRQLGVR